MEHQQQIHLSVQQEAAEKEYKRIKDAMKADIALINDAQRQDKPQRRTVRWPQELQRRLEPNEAAQAVWVNSKSLRHMYIAYAIFRGERTGRGIPEQNYFYAPGTNTINRKDGKAITTQENAPSIKYIDQILDKYGARATAIYPDQS